MRAHAKESPRASATRKLTPLGNRRLALRWCTLPFLQTDNDPLLLSPNRNQKNCHISSSDDSQLRNDYYANREGDAEQIGMLFPTQSTIIGPQRETLALLCLQTNTHTSVLDEAFYDAAFKLLSTNATRTTRATNAACNTYGPRKKMYISNTPPIV